MCVYIHVRMHVCACPLTFFSKLFFSYLTQNITFEGFDVAAVLAVDVDAFEEKVEGGEEEDEPTDNSPWANSDRDYTYEEVGII